MKTCMKLACTFAAVMSVPGLAFGQASIGCNTGTGVTCSGDVSSDPPSNRGAGLFIGDQAAGNVFVTNGGGFTLNSGTDVDASAFLRVGGQQAGGALQIFNDGLVSMTGNGTGAFANIRADRLGRTGRLSISGPSAQFVMSDQLADPNDRDTFNNDVYMDVGNFGGTGLLEITNGGLLSIAGAATAGLAVASDGNGLGDAVLVNGRISIESSGGEANANAQLVVGRNDGGGNRGHLRMLSQSSVSVFNSEGAAFMNIGERASRGTATINDSTVTVEGNGNAEMNIGNGAGAFGNFLADNNAEILIRSLDPNGFASFQLGNDWFNAGPNDAVARATIRNGASVAVDGGGGFGRAAIGDAFGAADSSAVSTLTIETGGTLEASDFVSIGAINPNNATATVTLNSGGTIDAPFIAVRNGGVLRGNGGFVNGTVALQGGLLDPGLSPGLMTMDALELEGGTVRFEIGGTGAGSFDQLRILGDLTISQPTSLIVEFINGYLPDAGAAWDLFSVAGAVTGDFPALADIDVMGLGSGTGLDFAFGAGGLRATAVAVAAVPLPAGLWLLLTGVGLLGLGKRRRSHVVAAT